MERNAHSLLGIIARRPWRSGLGLLAALSTLAVTLDGASGFAEPPSIELRAISSKFDARLSTVMIESSEPVAYVTSQPDPLTVIVDLRNVAAGVLAAPLGPLPPVTSVDVEDLAAADDGTAIARVRVKLERPASHRVHSSRNVIYVEVERSAGSSGSSGSPSSSGLAGSASSAAFAPAKAAATELRGVRALPNGSGVAIRADGELNPSVTAAKGGAARVWLDFNDVSAAKSVPAVTEVNQGEVQRVRVATNSRSPLVTRVVIDLAKQLAYRVERAGEELRVLFEAAAGQTGNLPAPVTPEIIAAPAPADAGAPAAPVTPAAPDAPGPVALGAPAAPGPSAPGAPGVPQAQAPVTPTEAGQRFRGTPISMDMQGADLRAVLRTFAQIQGLNIVIDPTIQGSVDVSLVDVPWDQALDIILRANKLGWTLDGSVVRIAPLTVLAQEQEEQRKLTESRALAGELRTLTVPLSYAKAPDLVPILTRSALSSRGEVQIDARTNTLIIRDLGDRLDAVAELVKILDRAQPQVEIEARIVQTNRDFARQLGVQWGVNGRVDPALGNTTNLAFPNNGAVTGRLGGANQTAVNLGASAPSTAIGLALGSVNGALNLDVVLSQLERSGRGRLLSTPRVSTQNNVEAEMTQGVEIPVQTVANNTVTVTFKPAALTLRVTPQITAANTVIMRVFLENASPDFSRSVQGIPPIDTQRAQTTVLVADGETTVIGGIYLSREQATEGRVPMLHRIPLLGWLFKRDELTDESRELLIFITPRITRS